VCSGIGSSGTASQHDNGQQGERQQRQLLLHDLPPVFGLECAFFLSHNSSMNPATILSYG
jgi:hypothetical protein